MNANQWQRKLAAFLHDPPTKPLDLAEHVRHEDACDPFLRAAGFEPEAAKKMLPKNFDWTAAAADRFPFPHYSKFPETSKFQGDTDTPFRHPLGGSDFAFLNHLTADLAADQFQTIQKGVVEAVSQMSGTDRDWANFFLHWRRWPVESAQKSPRTYFLPADTRIPDHNIWIHNAIASALTTSMDDAGNIKAAFLIFQLGPVQEFIAQARSTRDLWSGSYLLSWLTAHAIKAITDEIGPDCVIFPSLRGQPIFDLLHRDQLYTKVLFANAQGGNDTLWQRMKEHENEMLTPNLPNRFFAIVPSANAGELANAARDAVHEELRKIANATWDWFAEQGHPMDDTWRTRFDRQIEQFPQITWQLCPWPDAGVTQLVEDFVRLEAEAGGRLQTLHALATEKIPADHRDKRYFINQDPQTGQLNNSGFAWPYFYALTDRLLAARRNTRDFQQTPLDDQTLLGTTKDALSGKEESIGDEDWWNNIAKAQNESIKALFKHNDRLSAVNLIKKVWHQSYLANPRQQWNLEKVAKAVRFESVQDVAGDKTYFAVLALDGDEMGRWISGGKTPELRKQLSSAAQKYFDANNIGINGIKRPLSPAYHAQFSEALSNFALYLARPIINAFEGQLIYAGGDDVLAMLPAANALDCAEALRLAFQGRDFPAHLRDQQPYRMATEAGGFVTLKAPKGEQPKWPLIVPGPKTDVSVGIAIGHIKAPLQDMVRAAQAAEKRAKNKHNRSAFAVSLFKRSGEILEWGAKWDSGALDLYRQFTELSNNPPETPALSNRFGYALSARLSAYVSASENIQDVPEFPVAEVIKKEFEHVLRQQSRKLAAYKEHESQFKNTAIGGGTGYLANLIKPPDHEKPRTPPQIKDVVNNFATLFKVANFIHRGDE